MADPPTAYAPLVRRDNIRGVTRHMHSGQHGQDIRELTSFGNLHFEPSGRRLFTCVNSPKKRQNRPTLRLFGVWRAAFALAKEENSRCKSLLAIGLYPGLHSP